jgi:hypothetical protein
LICSSSDSHVLEFAPGTIRYESSANLNISLPGTSGRKSEAVIKYAAGPITDPWMTLALMEAGEEVSPLNVVRWVRSLRKSIIQFNIGLPLHSHLALKIIILAYLTSLSHLQLSNVFSKNLRLIQQLVPTAYHLFSFTTLLKQWITRFLTFFVP